MLDNGVTQMTQTTKGIYNKGFDIDLADAVLREKKLERIIKHAKIELKTDMLAIKTGNFFIEYECYDKPSGISTTTAGFWCLEIEGRYCFLVETQRLIDLCRKAYKEKRVANGGDYEGAKGVLLPISWLYLQPTGRIEHDEPAT